MKISIIVPVYNVEAYIEDCLKSITAQTYKGDIECIIVNDCTPDSSCAIIERFIEKYNGAIDFKFLHHTKNRGLSAARNTGIDAATGDYIYFIDSDDEITPECIGLLTEPIENNKYDFVIGDYATIGSNNEYPPILLNEGQITTKEEIRKTFFTHKWYMMAWNKLCNLEFIRKEKLYFKESLIHEDELWSFQLACVAHSMYVVKKETYKYKVRETSIMGQQNNVKKTDALSKITKEAYDWAIERGFIYEEGVLKKILSYREAVLSIIFSQETYKEQKMLYLKYYKKLRIASLQACKNNAIHITSLFKEISNYIPGDWGYHYLILYNFILRRQPQKQTDK